MLTGLLLNRMESLPEGIPIPKIISFEDYALYREGVSGGKKRGNNFKVDEDMLLIAGWLNTSLDTTIADCAKTSSFWKRIENYYIQNKSPDWPQRSVSSLCHRWSNIHQSVKRFCYFLTKVGELNKNSASNEGNIQEARIAFHSVTKQPFRFEHCWEILKNEQKWLDLCSKQITPKRKQAVQSSPLNAEYSNPESIDDATDDLHVISEDDNDERTPVKKATIESKNIGKTLLSDDLHAISEDDNDERTPGKKAAIEPKNVGKTLLSDDSTLSNGFIELGNEDEKVDEEKILKFNPTSEQSEFLEIQKAQLFEIKECNRIKNEKIKLEASKLKLQQSKEDVEIMLKDTSAMDPEQREYFRIRRIEILRRTSALI
ncbi:hypothetical protein Leryth_000008 [Lithospermum erythrorhizon]|nr:hypothetical protein Leryth_000008 [Lithospermum erythrorhizon]